MTVRLPAALDFVSQSQCPPAKFRNQWGNLDLLQAPLQLRDHGAPAVRAALTRPLPTRWASVYSPCTNFLDRSCPDEPHDPSRQNPQHKVGCHAHTYAFHMMECGRHSRDPHILLVLELQPSLGGLVCPLAPSHWLYHPEYDRKGQARTWLGPPGIGRTVLSCIAPTGNPILPQQGCPVSLLSRLWSPTKCSP